jgi:HAMP domain-containing protein
MLKNIQLNAKLNLLLFSIFLCTIIISGVVISFVLERSAKNIVTDQARILIETMSSVRQYTSTQVNPELANRLETESQFLPQTVPGYSAREVFEQLRTNQEYSDFFYKEATLNPTNLRDKADQFESNIVQNFRQNPELKEKVGFRSFANIDLFYIARPISITQTSCLRCHSTPELAPKSQLATYGEENGFGWKLNEIVGAQIISVPANKVFEKARRLQIIVIAIIAIFFLLAMVLLNVFLKTTVKNPLKTIVNAANKVAAGDMSAEFPQKGKDEFSILGASLNRMKISLQMAMDMLDPESSD